jgi:Mrp family chromosome partitioning ATPase
MAPGQRVVEVVGAGRDDGSAGRVAGNLAAALAAGGHSVTLLSLDPVDPVRPRGVPPVDLGAAELLSGDLPWDDAVLRTPEIPRLQYLGPGEATDGLSTALQSDAAAKLLSSLSESVDFLLVVPSPATANPDAQSVARLCDAVLVTVEIGRTPADDLVDAIGQFRQVGMEEVMCILVPPQRPSRGRGARRAAAGPDTHEVTATGDGNPEPGGNPEAGPGAGASSDRP